MRIAFSNWSNRLVGGAEHYLASVCTHLAELGHEVALWHETSAPMDRGTIPLPPNTLTWDATRLGVRASLEQLRRWNPNLTFCQGMMSPLNEAALQEIAPSVFFAHNYHGLCISGSRALRRPEVGPCPHRFGRGCLLRYYPSRCGGLNPFTMIEDYRTNRHRLGYLARYSAVVSHSAWTTSEYKRHGIECRQVRFFVSPEDGLVEIPEARPAGSPWKLLMMGRMSPNKGGELLLEALPLAASRLGSPLSLVLAGDGPSRGLWESRAAALRDVKGLEIQFSGWLSGEERVAALKAADVLLLPSIWPEPYGMIGLEAGLYGVPTVAFAVGGIPDWLQDGVNGCLAGGRQLSAISFADALVRCVSDPKRHDEMRYWARQRSLRLTIDQHCADLGRIFDEVASGDWHRHSATATDGIVANAKV